MYREEPLYPNKELRFEVGIPLSINHMYVRTYKGGQTLSKLAKDYVLKTRAKVQEVMMDNHFKKVSNASWYYLDLVIYMPDKKCRDSHNMLKLLLDTLQDILFENDYYIMPRILGVELDRTNPRVEVLFRPQKEEDRENLKIIS